MKTTRGITSVLMVTAAMTAPLRGQQAERPPRLPPQYGSALAGVALTDAIAHALDREPALRAARADIDVARGLRQQAGLRPNPTLSFERRNEPSGTDNQTSVGVVWPLDLFRRPGRVQTANRELAVTEFAVADRERVLVANVRLAYGAAAAAVRDVAVADEVITVARRQRDLVRARVDAGSSPPLDRDLLEVDLRRLETDRLLAVGRADSAMVLLKQVMGMAPEEPLLLRETIEQLVAGHGPTGATPAFSAAFAARPDVLEAGAEVAVADARIDQARREGRVEVSLFGTYMRMDAGFPQLGFGPTAVLERVRGRFEYVAGGAMVTVPVFNRNQGGVAAAEARRVGAEARREAAVLAARAEIASAQISDEQAQRAVNLYAGGIRGLARQNLDVVRQTFDLGRATVFDVLAEQRRFLEIEQAYTAALRAAWEARAALKRALGELT